LEQKARSKSILTKITFEIFKKDSFMINFIPQIEPWIDDKELTQITEVIKNTYISENKKTEEFLNLILGYTNAKYAIAMSNGTLALIACLMAEGIGPGDEIIVPDFTFVATANAVLFNGATPVFCDVLMDTGCLDPVECEKHISNRTKAIIPVHLYGHAADMDKIIKLSKKYDILVIEDAAESLGVFLNGKQTGTFGAYGIFSFFPNKVITCAEGGVVVVDSEDKLKKLYRIKNHGRDQKGTFIHHSIGYNFCFSDLHAAIGVAQFSKIEKIIERKKMNFETYQNRLADIDEIHIMTPQENVTSNFWFCNILVENPNLLGEHLHSYGIGSRRFFYPLHRQPCYRYLTNSGNYSSSNYLYEHGLSLPSSPTLTDEQLSYICDIIEEYYTK
jgi:perosamine synthetase